MTTLCLASLPPLVCRWFDDQSPCIRTQEYEVCRADELFRFCAYRPYQIKVTGNNHSRLKWIHAWCQQILCRFTKIHFQFFSDQNKCSGEGRWKLSEINFSSNIWSFFIYYPFWPLLLPHTHKQDRSDLHLDVSASLDLSPPFKSLMYTQIRKWQMQWGMPQYVRPYRPDRTVLLSSHVLKRGTDWLICAHRYHPGSKRIDSNWNSMWSCCNAAMTARGCMLGPHLPTVQPDDDLEGEMGTPASWKIQIFGIGSFEKVRLALTCHDSAGR